jgi:hypothetical protein
MRRTKRALGSALVIFVAVAAALGLAQSESVAQDLTRPAAGGWATGGMLAPADIIIAARRAGFEPISRPVQRGPVYVLFALDDGDVDVKLTVDARSGRVLWVRDVIGPRYSGYYGYPALPRYGRPPLPPGDIPDIGHGRNNFRPDGTTASVRRSPPLPRTRPADLTGAVNKQSAAPAQAAAKESAPPAAPSLPSAGPLFNPPRQAGDGRVGVAGGKGAGNAAPPGRSDAVPAAMPRPSQPTMVPVAPLE